VYASAFQLQWGKEQLKGDMDKEFPVGSKAALKGREMKMENPFLLSSLCLPLFV
jgi:hypothetical protein